MQLFQHSEHGIVNQTALCVYGHHHSTTLNLPIQPPIALSAIPEAAIQQSKILGVKMWGTFANIFQVLSQLCLISQLLHWPSNSEPSRPCVTIQPLPTAVWVQTSLNLALPHVLSFLPSPYHWCHLKLQIGGQLMPSIPLFWPFLNAPLSFTSNPLQVVTVLPNIHV